MPGIIQKHAFTYSRRAKKKNKKKILLHLNIPLHSLTFKI